MEVQSACHIPAVINKKLLMPFNNENHTFFFPLKPVQLEDIIVNPYILAHKEQEFGYQSYQSKINLEERRMNVFMLQYVADEIV